MKLNEIKDNSEIANWINRFAGEESHTLGASFLDRDELLKKISLDSDGKYVLPTTVKNIKVRWSGKFEAPPFILNGVNWLIFSSNDCDTVDLGFVKNAWVLSFIGNLGNLNHYVGELGKLETPLGSSHRVNFKANKPCSGLIETLHNLQRTRVHFDYIPIHPDLDLKQLGGRGFKLLCEHNVYTFGFAGEAVKYDNLFDVQDRLVNDGFAEFI
ncbi:hypothetical protein RsoM2USA_312 [Ralstonia phage RsoM2USA]|nr:hypothetical protein RsoM2USA_312 [Ralstonia phage RsoM2USA]